MKKLLLLLCCSILVFGGCAKQGSEEQKDTEKNPVQTESEVNTETTETTESTESTETEVTQTPQQPAPEPPKVVVTDEMVVAVKNRNIAYRQLLENDMAFGDGWGAYAFGLTDVDNNEVPELVVSTGEPSDWRYPGTIVTWNGQSIIWGFDAWATSAIYYCPTTGYFAPKELVELNQNKAMFDDMSGYIHIMKFGVSEAVTEYGMTYLKDSYSFEVDFNGQFVGANAGEAAGVLGTCMPTEVLLESPYENNAQNRDKYLPIDDATIRALLENS